MSRTVRITGSTSGTGPMETAFSNILAPGRIGTLELRNRIFVTAMGVSLAEDDGSRRPADRLS